MNFTLARSQLISTLMIEVGNLHVVNSQAKCLSTQVFCLMAVVFRKSWIWDSGSAGFFSHQICCWHGLMSNVLEVRNQRE